MPSRTDNVPDERLASALLLARRGQAYFSRKLNELRDDEFDAASLLPGWDRRHVAAHVGYNARAIARLVHWAATGTPTPMYSSPAARGTEIEFGASLPVRAIRTLSDHAAVHLSVAWRDLPEQAWSRQVTTAQGRQVPVAETVWMRTREVWLHAVDLDNGGHVEDLPAALHDLLLADLAAVWARKRAAAVGSNGGVNGSPNIVLAPIDRDRGSASHDTEPGGIVVRGTAAALVAWGTGRGRSGVRTADGSPVPVAPQWL